MPRFNPYLTINANSQSGVALRLSPYPKALLKAISANSC